MKFNTLLLSAAAAVSLFASCGSSSTETSAVLFDDVIATRRSVRAYDADKKISEAEVRELLISTQQAPSWANMQPSKYYVAISQDKIDAVKEVIGSNKRNVEGAPVLIVSTFEKGKSGFFQGNPANEAGDLWGAYDNGLSNAYFVLKARAMGFDTLIMGMRDSEALRGIFNIPETEAVMAVISLGYRTSDPSAPRHRNLDEIVKFF